MEEEKLATPEMVDAVSRAELDNVDEDIAAPYRAIAALGGGYPRGQPTQIHIARYLKRITLLLEELKDREQNTNAGKNS